METASASETGAAVSIDTLRNEAQALRAREEQALATYHQILGARRMCEALVKTLESAETAGAPGPAPSGLKMADASE